MHDLISYIMWIHAYKNITQPHFMIGRQSGHHRPNDGRYRRLSADDSLIKPHRPTVWR